MNVALHVRLALLALGIILAPWVVLGLVVLSLPRH